MSDNGAGLLDPRFWGYRGPDSDLLRLVVVGPYPTEDFFERLARELEPHEVVLVVDDGWSADYLDQIRKRLGKMRIPLKIRYASLGEAGLVHAKLYFLDWRAQDTTERQVLWGSANASKAAYERNAEALSSVRVGVPGGEEGPRAIDSYLNGLTTEQRVDHREISVGDRFALRLPSMALTDDRAPATFDAWLQAGRLCHRYQPDPVFGKISIPFDKPLEKDVVERSFARENLAPEGERKAFRWKYLKGDTDIDESRPKWRSTFFIETWLGYWTSDACFRARGGDFRAPGRDGRMEVLEAIQDADDAKRAEWVIELLDRTRKAILRLKKRSPRFDTATYIRVTQNGRINGAYYGKIANNQLIAQQRRAKDPVFEKHFINGYEFPDVPPFRGSAASFEEFAESFCEGLQFAIGRGRLSNRLAAAFVHALEESGGDSLDREKIRGEMSARELLAQIRARWAEIGAKIRHFYENDDQARTAGEREGPRTCQEWLRSAGYDTIADQIRNLEDAWKEQGSKVRRNWWDVLAGTEGGDKRKIGGIEFPILAAARERKRWHVTDESLRRKNEPPFPPLEGEDG